MIISRRTWLQTAACLTVAGRLARSETTAPPTLPTVQTGLDQLVRDKFAPLRGQRVGLITNHTGVDSAGQRTIDLLAHAPQVQLERIFSPEHGVAGALDQANIDDTRDATTGLPIVSLYGETRKPTAEMLADLDTLVFDIQDIGARFYTYLSTMKKAMLVAEGLGKKFVVLDRPSPLGGEVVEGPMIDPDQLSFVGCHEIPVRHGLTLGECAQLIRAESGPKLSLEIVKLTGWRRADHWEATGLVWVNPSPNMRRLTAAEFYPGIGMLETTNVSVGRGTDTPFEVVGAPWIKPASLAAALRDLKLPGVAIYPRRFTPTASVFANEACGGISLEIMERSLLRPVALGLAIAHTLRRLYPTEWQPERFIRLMGCQRVQTALTLGMSLSELLATAEEGVQGFVQRRREFLLY